MATRTRTRKTDEAQTRPPGGGETRARKRPSREAARRGGEATRGKSNPDRSNERGRESSETGRLPALRRGVATVGGAITGAGAKAVEGATANPVPAVLVGAGLAWLMVERVNRRTHMIERAGEAIGEAVGSVGERLAETAQTVKGAAGAVADNVREGASTVGEYTREGASTIGEAIRSASSAVGERVGRSYRNGRKAVVRTWQDYPLAMGIATLAAGVAAGMMLPRTRREQKMMGRQAAEVARRVRTTGNELMERGKKAATSAAEATAREAHRVGLAPEELGRKIKRIATSARAAAAGRAAE